MTSDDVVAQIGLMVPMRDGIRLKTNIYRPASPGAFPVLVSRYPYPPDSSEGPYSMDALARAMAQQGYVGVVQHCRGLFGSEGTFLPVEPDLDDGYDTVEWAAEQPWSNGRVGMWGWSYSGFAAWAAALAKPPHLVAIAPASSTWSFTENCAWRYIAPGVLGLGMSASWSAMMGGDAPPIADLADLTAEIRDDEAATPAADPLTLISSMLEDSMLGQGALRDLAIGSWWSDWCDHVDPRDPYNQRVSAKAHFDELELPVLHLAGWNDYFFPSSLDAYQTLTKFGTTEAVRDAQRLVVGPWVHYGPLQRPDADPDVDPFWNVGPGSPVMRFFDRYVKEEPAGDDDPKVQIYVQGDNSWRDEHEWPLDRTKWTSYFLHSGGQANTRDGDGVLSIEAPASEQPDRFVYDPADPVRGAMAPGFDMVRETGDRADVLVYSTPRLANDFEVTGPVTLEVWVSSSVADTDFTAKLIDVFPDGSPVTLCQGVIRTAVAAERPVQPGAIYRFEIDLWATSNVFKAGHRIRLDVSSSDFPLYELNPNTGARSTHDTTGETVPATQHVFHDAQHPSRLVLPIIPR